ncbi:MAG: hypothetical protein ACOH2G_03415 [Ewingella sp.]
MDMTFTMHPVPELILSGKSLTDHGFTVDRPIKLLLRQQALWVTTVTDQQDWDALCEASQYDQDLGADWVHNDGRLVIGGDWLTEIGITQAGHVDVATAPGIIIIRRREGGVFRA